MANKSSEKRKKSDTTSVYDNLCKQYQSVENHPANKKPLLVKLTCYPQLYLSAIGAFLLQYIVIALVGLFLTPSGSNQYTYCIATAFLLLFLEYYISVVNMHSGKDEKLKIANSTDSYWEYGGMLIHYTFSRYWTSFKIWCPLVLSAVYVFFAHQYAGTHINSVMFNGVLGMLFVVNLLSTFNIEVNVK